MLSQKFCKYIYVSGKKKGTQCGKFCRSRRDLCFCHFSQFNKHKKIIESKLNGPVDVQEKQSKETSQSELPEPINEQAPEINIPIPKVELLTINTLSPKGQAKRALSEKKISVSSSSDSSSSYDSTSTSSSE